MRPNSRARRAAIARCAVPFVLLCLTCSSWAVDPDRAMSQYIRQRWGVEQGFPRGPVYAITQTPDGYLWVGTEAGLLRFDGLNFQMITDPARVFSIVGVLGLMPDVEGNLWVRVQGPWMLRYRDGQFQNPLADERFSNITAMCQATDGSLIASAPEQGTVVHRNGRFTILADATSLARSPVMSIAQTAAGDVWMGTRDAGLFRILNGETRAIMSGLPDPKVNCLLPDGAEGVWIGTDDGVARWDGRSLTPPGAEAALRGSQVLAMAKDRDDNVWFGTNVRGLLRLNDRGLMALDDIPGKGPSAVSAIFEDRERNLWIGGANGIERLRDSVFVTYTKAEGMPTENSGPVFVDAEGRTWFAPIGGGLYWMKDGKFGAVSAAGLPSDVVYSITGNAGTLWVGRQRGGLTRLRLGEHGVSAETFTRKDGLAQDSVYSVYRSRDGTVWVGTLSGGVSRFRDGQFTTFTRADGLASNTVASILETSDGTVWFATPSGLSALRDGKWRTYLTQDGLPSANINTLLEDSEGVLWIGTSAGIVYFSEGRIHGVASAPMSLRAPIFGMADDRHGSLWVTTSNHVMRAGRAQLMRDAIGDGDVRAYEVADGLRSVEGVKRHRSVVADAAGRIWFSMNRGLSVVNPSRLIASLAPAVAHIQSIEADGTRLELRDGVHIPAGRQRIAIEYAGLSLSLPERVRFRYRLDGFDTDWNAPVSVREAVYTNLGPGSYRFRVLTSNPDGVWNGSEASIEFEIEPVFWQTWWFRIGAALALALAVIGGYRMRMHRLTEQLNVRFEERLVERTRIAQDLHDTLLQGFLSASMQLHVAADRLPEDSAAKPPINRVLQLMTQVIDEGRNAVRGLRSSQELLPDLEQAFSMIKDEFPAKEDVEFRVIVEGRPRPLHPILRDEVYRIGREALVNAFRHSGANQIEVEIDYAVRQFHLMVRDNGRGIDPRVLNTGREGHWGLTGMRERAERIGAQFHVWSGPTTGTELVISMPNSIAFPAQRSSGLLRLLIGSHSHRDKEGI